MRVIDSENVVPLVFFAGIFAIALVIGAFEGWVEYLRHESLRQCLKTHPVLECKELKP